MTEVSNQYIDAFLFGKNLVDKIYILEKRLRQFEVLFDGLKGIENITESLQILDQRLGSIEEELSRTSDKINDLECKVDDLESVDVEDHIRDIMRVATLTIDI